MQRVFNGATKGMGSILSMPATISKVVIGVVVVGGIALILLIGGLSWGIGTGRQNIAETVNAAGYAAGNFAKLAV